MYCANCGVKLADTEKRCPLCGTEAYHPDIERPEVSPLYPKDFVPKREISKATLHIILISLFLIPILVTLYCDFYINKTVTWSAYVALAIFSIYIIVILPTWFKRPTPAVFVPIDFLTILLLLHYINYSTGGDWFLSFAFPVVTYLGLIVTATCVLLYYLKKGHLYVIGGFFIALGFFMDIIELFIMITFKLDFDGWSLIPMIPLVLLGLGMIAIATSRSAREALARKLHF
ncbi:MAG: zinc ribbon domain-containing protein [Clostridia bacterium]|nr:zinc ribbon domain-containing protein [Clostridia bacterium]